MNKLFLVAVLGLMLVGGVYASSVDFFYSENCPHCKQVYSLVVYNSKYFPINFIDINQGSYNIQGVPLIRILTLDKRNIELVGSEEIPRWLVCELNEQSTLDCPTTPNINCETNSFFIR